MKLFLVSPNTSDSSGFTQPFVKAVICASSEESARQMQVLSSSPSWNLPGRVKVTYLGEASPGVAVGVVCVEPF